MKSILVIDTPKKCGDCHLCYKDNFDEDSWFTFRCQVSADQVQYDNIYKNCPLKSMPQYMTMRNTVSCDYNEAFVNGFNTCIDEILGE